VKLRPYQEHWLGQIRQAHLDGHLGVVAQMPTGAGKTVAGIAEPCRRMALSGRPVLLIVHRDELVRQTADKLSRFGLEYGIIAAKFGKNKNPLAQVQIAMVKTLRNRLGKEPIRRPRYIIMDECHLSGAKTYQDILEHYKDVPRLGLSATPWRMDGVGFENLGTKLVMGPTVSQMNEMWKHNNNTGLVPARCFSIPMADLAAIRRDRRGEYDLRAAAMQYERQALVGGVVDEYIKHAGDRKGIVFCTSIEHSSRVRDQFRKIGVAAEHLDGTTSKEKRAEMLSGLESGEIQVICNCSVLVEGLDITSIGAISIAVPTRSLSKYLQMVGRAARPHPGKKDYIVLDHGGCVLRLGTPDYENEWSIATRERTPGVPRGVDRDIFAKICDECRFANEITATNCASCGSPLLTKREILTREGMLVEVKPKTAPKKKYRQMRETHAEIERRMVRFVSRSRR
tara:strand:- start:4851 stop:6215 length:1365 start_codon:yes stop_codon:yes gene_type:complete